MARKIGKGTKYSIAKAALIWSYKEEQFNFIYTGDLDAIHAIVDITGAKHASMFTA